MLHQSRGWEGPSRRGMEGGKNYLKCTDVMARVASTLFTR